MLLFSFGSLKESEQQFTLFYLAFCVEVRSRKLFFASGKFNSAKVVGKGCPVSYKKNNIL